MNIRERNARTWIDSVADGGWAAVETAESARVIREMLAQPRVPEKPNEAVLDAMEGAFAKCPMGVRPMVNAYRRLRAELSAPATRTVEVWRVEWWTTGAELPGCDVFLCKGNADAFAEGVKSEARSACVRVTEPHQHELPA